MAPLNRNFFNGFINNYEDALDDVVDPASSDLTLSNLYRKLKQEHKEKGLVYHAVAKSKFFGHLKWLLTWHPTHGFTILDLDTNIEYKE